MKASLGWISVVLLLLTSCSSKFVIDEAAYPLREIQRAVAASLPGGVRIVSPNRREFYSRYFLPNTETKNFEYAEKAPARAFAKVTVLGDRRPYVVEVLVQLEERVGFQGNDPNLPIYKADRTDKELAKNLGVRIQQTLKDRRQNSDLFDEFRAF